MKTLAFFNNKGGVGKTTLVYHLAWMFAELGLSVLAADLDPQANLTSMFLGEDELEEIWDEDHSSRTVAGCLAPELRRSIGGSFHEMGLAQTKCWESCLIGWVIGGLVFV